MSLRHITNFTRGYLHFKGSWWCRNQHVQNGIIYPSYAFGTIILGVSSSLNLNIFQSWNIESFGKQSLVKIRFTHCYIYIISFLLHNFLINWLGYQKEKQLNLHSLVKSQQMPTINNAVNHLNVRNIISKSQKNL